jgi:trimethylamine--corrinoid protein Co-methyltransferase
VRRDSSFIVRDPRFGRGREREKMRTVELLSAELVEQVHEASLEILESVGVLVCNEKARARFGRHGCRVDAESQVVRIPRAVVEEERAAFPSRFTLHARDPETDRTLPDDGPLLATGSSAPDVVDPLTGELRRARSDDIARIAHLVNELPGYDVFSVSVTADDAPPGQQRRRRFSAWAR